MKIVADTNIYLHNINILDNYDNIVYLSHVNRELENHKSKKGELGFLARSATRYVEDNRHRFIFDTIDYKVESDDLDPSYEDNRILFACIKNDYALMTRDIALKHKAKCYGVTVIEPEVSEEDGNYKGYRFVDLTDQELARFYENKDENIFNLHINEYVILRDENQNTLDKYRWDGSTHASLVLPPKKYIRAKNDLQECVLDLLMNKDIPIKFIAGSTGSGKTYLSTKMALYHVKEKGNHAKIMMVRNPMGSGEEIGFLKGDMNTKTEGFFNSITQHLDQGELEAQAMEQRGELTRNIPFYMKGLSIPDTYIIVDEAEDMDSKLIKMLGTRPAGNTVITFSGDWNQSEDKYVNNNGLKSAINHFKGEPLAGTVVLDIDVRSDASRVFADWDI